MFIVWHYNLITGETLFFSADELNENDGNKRTKKSSEKSKLSLHLLHLYLLWAVQELMFQQRFIKINKVGFPI